MLAAASLSLTLLFVPGCDEDDDDPLAPPVASEIGISGGNNQTVAMSTASTPLEVTVQDQYDDVLAGVTVSWVVVSGSGTLASATSVTNGDGEATVVFTAGTTAGPVVITATVTGLAPATFAITVQ
jgi:hypothetical protein